MERVTHEEIEQAFAPAVDIIGRLPECTDTTRSRENLKIAERYLHDHVERVEAAEARRES